MELIFTCCLYGNNPRYIDSLFSNNLRDISNYIGVSCEFHIYCNVDVDENIKKRISEHGYKVFTLNFDETYFGSMFVRYIPILEKKARFICVRDTDCCYTLLELDLIKEWMKSDFSFHVIRGHLLHIYPIMGGLFSIREDGFDDFIACFNNSLDLVGSNEYNKDQIFLAKSIYPDFIERMLVHTVRVAYSKENYIHYSSSSDFIGETILNDEKRKNEKSIFINSNRLVIFPQWISKYSTNKIVARLMTYISRFWSVF
ncbi:hypothetical protein ICR46_002602 [Vibrio cholerae]|nr:hypothetical protein [Vibrio cholerae]BCN21643.1 hypothetical protein [Vibrio cholerae]GIA03941.1 hypothetical protein VCSRO83_2694 [Vibrio cholerae]